MWEVRWKKRAEKDLKNIPDKDKLRILATLPMLAKDPFAGKKLEGELLGLHSYRVWPYRIIYKIYKNFLLVIIIRVGHRQEVYK